MKYFFISALIVVIDQLSKVAVRANMYVGESISVIGDFFRLTHIENYGAAFSLLSGYRLFLILVPVVAIIVAVWYLHSHKDEHWMMASSVVVIIAGGIGNLIDRIAFGKVTDMFDFSIFPPVFNVADIAVTLGCVMLIIYVLFAERFKGSHE